jgi:uncharacterized protein YijF (DUF1287 family)
MHRRTFIAGSAAFSIAAAKPARAARTAGARLAEAARAQVGITTSYDPLYTRLSYPNGDVSRSTGVCADVVIRAFRDALAIDLQSLVHEDMLKHFDEYPAHRVWGERSPDASIDHRRVLNLQRYFERTGAQLWKATSSIPGDKFPAPLADGDIVTWLLDARLPHIGILVSAGARVVHNIGRGTEESSLADFSPHRAIAHYRWPSAA